ncbi:DUF4326 domain-containing protein [Aminobacter sp. MDW-2]|nr:DUF4326 domain-containing protein [Aminobacter sp. MDW-2]MRX31865.1 DUF4326 domain-containing protein [Aminobacter sp. MDW-2]QNH32341.1 DUF4326 domain-containing protein [Aminobacter sp. MDW-2]
MGRRVETPVRVQLSRKKGWKMPENTVNVARPNRWGNDWKVGSTMFDPATSQFRTCETVEDAIQAFRNSVDWDPDAKTTLPTTEGGTLEIWGGFGPYHRNRKTIRAELAGKNLACWCRLDQPCHADVLLELANSPAPVTQKDKADG